MKWLSHLIMAAGLLLTGFAGYQIYDSMVNERATLENAYAHLEEQRIVYASEGESDSEGEPAFDVMGYDEDYGQVFGVLTIPALDDRSIGIIEGVDDDALAQGVGHVESTAFPGQGEQIVLSGHRDSVFRDFSTLVEGNRFIVDMLYGTYEYEIKEIVIVDADDRTVIGPMGEEVLVVSTCYPFGYIGPAPQRAVFYAYPVN